MEFDLVKLQNSYFEAARANADIANEMMSKTHGWLLALATAELAFVGYFVTGGLGLTNNPVDRWLLYISVCLILLNFVFFFAGSFYQRAHVLKSARQYYHLSQKVTKMIQETGSILKANQLPDNLLDTHIKALKTNAIANKLFLVSFGLVGLSTLLLMFFVYRIIFYPCNSPIKK
jgi:hypothetical protein